MKLFIGTLFFNLFGIALLQIRIKYVDTLIKYVVIVWEVMVIFAFYDSKEISLLLRGLLVIFSVAMIVYAVKKNQNNVVWHSSICGISNKQHEKIDNIQIKIGLAEVTADSRSRLKIKIKGETGKEYTFSSVGNDIESFTINGKTYYYGG